MIYLKEGQTLADDLPMVHKKADMKTHCKHCLNFFDT